MYLKCAHPDCSSDFNNGHGRLFRFQQDPQQNEQPSHWHSMKHFWLCSKCSETFTIGYRKGLGVLLMDRIQGLSGDPASHFVLRPDTVETVVDRRLPRRSGRAVSRERKRIIKLPPVQASAIEILENRNLERSG